MSRIFIGVDVAPRHGAYVVLNLSGEATYYSLASDAFVLCQSLASYLRYVDADVQITVAVDCDAAVLRMPGRLAHRAEQMRACGMAELTARAHNAHCMLVPPRDIRAYRNLTSRTKKENVWAAYGIAPILASMDGHASFSKKEREDIADAVCLAIYAKEIACLRD